MARRARVNANGLGTTYRMGGQRTRPWAAVLVVGWTLEGRPIRRTRFASSEREAKAMLADMRAAHASGLPLPDYRLTVGQWLVRWLAHIRPSVRPSTYANYEGVVRRYLLPELGTVKLLTLQPSRVEAMLNRLTVGPHARASARDVLGRALQDAVKDGVIARNAAKLARAPRMPSDQSAAPSTAVVRALVAALEGHRLRDMVLVMAATGLRVSEAMGLRWDDVGDDALTVRVQLARVDGEPVLAEPKSARSRRTIALAPVAVEALRRQRDAQARERFGSRAIGRGWDSGLVFTTADGRPLSESTVQWVMARACREAGIRHVSPHDLRRWAATTVAATGDMKAAQEMLGHTSATLTSDVYASPTGASRKRAADAIEEAIG